MAEIIDFSEKYAGLTDLKQIAEMIQGLQEEHKVKKAAATAVWNELEYLKKSLGPEIMGELTIAKWDNFPYRVQQQSSIYASCIGGVTDEVKDWLFENEGDALVKDSVNASALKAWLKKRIAAGKPFPAELFKVEPYNFIVVVKA